MFLLYVTWLWPACEHLGPLLCKIRPSKVSMHHYGMSPEKQCNEHGHSFKHWSAPSDRPAGAGVKSYINCGNLKCCHHHINEIDHLQLPNKTWGHQQPKLPRFEPWFVDSLSLESEWFVDCHRIMSRRCSNLHTSSRLMAEGVVVPRDVGKHRYRHC